MQSAARSLSHVDTYFIKPGYQANPMRGGVTSYSHAIQSPADIARRMSYQYEVYRFAQNLIRRFGFASLLDIGCGTGEKLNCLIRPTGVAVTGIDGPASIDYCRSTYKFGNWIAADISTEPKVGRVYDLIVAADIIEHLVDPDCLIAWIRKSAHSASYVVVSTPERDRLWGEDHFGPPPNPLHIREWNGAEFVSYLQSRGLEVLSHRLLPDRTVGAVRRFLPQRIATRLPRQGRTCQLVLARVPSRC